MKKIKIVIVLEGGNIQSVFVDCLGVEIVKVDFDVLGFSLSELKRVYQNDKGSKKSYKYATVSCWENIEISPMEIKRYFGLVKGK